MNKLAMTFADGSRTRDDVIFNEYLFKDYVESPICKRGLNNCLPGEPHSHCIDGTSNHDFIVYRQRKLPGAVGEDVDWILTDAICSTCYLMEITWDPFKPREIER